MPTLYIDFETHMNSQVSLRKMTLRQYCEVSHVLGLAWAVDDGPAQYTTAPEEDKALLDVVEAIRTHKDDWVVVAHNAAFDIRVWSIMLGWEWPAHIHCSLELAMCAWPNQPGGYSLNNLSTMLGMGEKIDIDLENATPEELAVYAVRDVELCRDIHKAALERVPECEIAIAELCNRARELTFIVDPDRYAFALDQFSEAVTDAAKEAMALLGDEDSFGINDDGSVRSVKPHVVKEKLIEKFGFFTDTISVKKISEGVLAANPDAADAVRAAGATNRALVHRRSIAKFAGCDVLDAELGFFRAHTGRFSSPSVGRGLNLLNMPKHDKRVARPFRSMFRLPPEYVFVTADAANAEYRMLGWLSDCKHTKDLFTSDVLADPYLAFGKAATGIDYAKDDPARQVWKTAVLGLTFLMGPGTFIKLLLGLCSGSDPKITLDDLQEMIDQNYWSMPSGNYAQHKMREMNAPEQVVTVAFAVHEQFKRRHPEFGKLANWLEQCAQVVACSPDPETALKYMCELSDAPDREKLELAVGTDPLILGRTLRARCGLWTPTVTWRDLGVRPTVGGRVGLTNMQVGRKGYRLLTQNVMIENVTQSASRNSLCALKLKLQDKYPLILSEHDSIRLVVPRTHEAVAEAREDLCRLAGPGNSLGYDWAYVMDPSEISVSETFNDDEVPEELS